MPKKIRWGRVGAALTTLALSPLAVLASLAALAPEPVFQDPGGTRDCDAGVLMDQGVLVEAADCRTFSPPTELLPTYQAAHGRLQARRADVGVGHGDTLRAAEEAIALWRLGVRFERNGNLTESAVGSAISLRASEVIEEVLEAGALTSDELAWLEGELAALGAVPVEPAALATREQADAAERVWEYLPTRYAVELPLLAWQATGWDDVAADVAVVGTSSEGLRRLLHELERPMDRFFVDRVVDSESTRNRALVLSMAAGLRRGVAETGRCPDELGERVALRPTVWVTYDPRACVIAVDDHPERSPLIYGPFSP